MVRLLVSFIRNLVILCIAFLPFACERSFPPPADEKPPADTLRFDVFKAFESLNPANAGYTGASWHAMVFSTLAMKMPDGSLRPDLAGCWRYDSQHRALRIELRPDAKFHNGMSVTAKDVIFSFRQFADEYSGIVDKIDRMVPVSKHALEIVLKIDDPSFFELIQGLLILPYNVAQTTQNSQPIGSGPYRFKKRIDDGQILLTAFEGYYGGRPAFERMIFTHVASMEQTWTRLLTGRTDIAVRLSPDNFRRMAFIRDRFHISQSPSWFCKILLFNTFDPRFSDVRVRRALSLGINRDYIVRKILLDYGKVATGPLGVDSPYAREKSPPRPYDPEKANQLLSAAGWKRNAVTGALHKGGLALEFDLLYMSESPMDKQVAQFIQLCLHDLGVIIRPVPADFKAFTRAYLKNTDFQAVLTETMGLYDSYAALLMHWLPTQGRLSNMGGFTSPEIIKLLTAMSDTSTNEERKTICQAVEDYLLALQPAAFLYQRTEIDVISKRINLPYFFSGDSGSIQRLYTASVRQDR